jgi:hypothetical protein
MHPFQNEQTWTGGSFEILFYLGEKEGLLLLEKLWSEMGFDGPYIDNKVLPTNQDKLKVISNIESTNIYGTSIFDNKTVACSTTTIKDEDGVWIYFGFPLGGLSEVYDVGAYPFEDGKNHAWTERLAQYLRELAEMFFSDVSFYGAIIGWLTAVEVDELLDAVKSGVPEERWFWYLINDNGKLGWYPQNKQEPLMTIQP